jgi:hypothetical protein
MSPDRGRQREHCHPDHRPIDLDQLIRMRTHLDDRSPRSREILVHAYHGWPAELANYILCFS